MSVDQTAITMWSKESVKQWEQSESLLMRNIKNVKTNSKVYNFHVNTTTSTPTDHDHSANRFDEILPDATTHSLVPVNLTVARDSKWVAYDDLDMTNIDFRSDARDAVISGINRKIDFRITTALKSTTTTAAGLAGNIVSYANLKKIQKAMNLAKVPMGGRKFLLGASGLDQLLDDDKIINKDYIQTEAVKNGFVKGGILGMDLLYMEDQDLLLDDGLATPKPYVYAFHQDAVGIAWAKTPTFAAHEVPTRDAVMFFGKINCGVSLIQPTGVFKYAITA